MQTLQVITETEKPGHVLVEAYSEATFQRQGQAVGFFVRRRKAGDQFMLSNWQEFSPRWMKFVGSPPADWVEKIEGREKNSQNKAEIASVEQGKTAEDRMRELARSAAGEALSLAQAARPQEIGQFQSSDGKIIPREQLSLKK